MQLSDVFFTPKLWFGQFPLWTSVIVGVLQTRNIISVCQAPTNLLLEPVNVLCNLIGGDKSSNENQ